MNPNDYRENTDRTDHKDYSPVVNRMNDNEELVRFAHYASGCCTEAAELMDIFKKALVYGKPIDPLKVLDESGDLLWYIDRLCKMYGFTLEQAFEANINKLRTRYPQGFTEEAALNRNLEKEREVLEKK